MSRKPMTNEDEAVDAIAELLRTRCPRKKVAGVLMQALERYSTTLEGPSETELRSCLVKLLPMVENRLRSI